MTLGFLLLATAAGCSCVGVWLLGFGYRGRDSAWSVAAGIGLILACFLLVWCGLPLTLTGEVAQ